MLKYKKGFTLLELLIVFSLSVIVFSISIYGQKTFLNTAHSQTLKLHLLNAIQFAKNQALAKQTSIRVCGSDDGKTCSGDWEKALLVVDQSRILFEYTSIFSGKLHARFFPKWKNDLEFFANGWLSAENGTFWFCTMEAKNPDWAIVLNKSGRARVVDPDKMGLIKDDTGKPLLC